MKKYSVHIILICMVIACFAGCERGPEDEMTGSPRLVVRGYVSNEANEPLANIRVAVYGVREADEPDIITYNYAITDTAGMYEIIRYRNRDLPQEVTVIATDSAGVYSEQEQQVGVVYDTGMEGTAYNGYVTADFILSPLVE